MESEIVLAEVGKNGDWKLLRSLPNHREVDFHPDSFLGLHNSFDEKMNAVYKRAFDAISKAQQDGIDWVLLVHGWSTSRNGRTSTRSVIRSLMRSPKVTPFINRAKCLAHNTVYVVATRKLEVVRDA